jgi:amino acid transporter
MVAAEDGILPAFLAKKNRFGAPIMVLFIQALIFTAICGMFLLMPSVNSSYWILSNITAILSLTAYLFMFAAAIKLRYSHPRTPRSYKIPGGKVGMWVVSLSGAIMSVLTIIIGFFPPTDIDVGNVFHYELILVGSVVLFIAIPLVIAHTRSRK